MKILIAEDEKDIIDQYFEFLTSLGHEVFMTSNGQQCIEKYFNQIEKNPDQAPFDLVILDQIMPELTGIDTAKRILSEFPEQRIIFASAYLDATLMESIKRLKQIIETLQKPFRFQELADMIEDKKIYLELTKLNVNIKNLKELQPTHEQISDYLAAFKKLQIQSV